MDSVHRLIRRVSGWMFSKYICVPFMRDVSNLCRTLPEGGGDWVPVPRGSRRDVFLSSTVYKEKIPYLATQDLSRVLKVSLNSDGSCCWDTGCDGIHRALLCGLPPSKLTIPKQEKTPQTNSKRGASCFMSHQFCSKLSRICHQKQDKCGTLPQPRGTLGDTMTNCKVLSWMGFWDS